MRETSRKIPILLHMGMAAMGLASDPIRNGENLSDDFWQEDKGQQIAASMEKTLRGMQKYVALPPRTIQQPPVIWKYGETCIREYKGDEVRAGKTLHGRILIIPSLINGYEIVDLHPQRSFAKYMANSGFDVLIIDWGDLKKDDDLRSFENILTKRVAKIAEFLGQEKADKPLMGVGYCMGGVLLAATEILYPQLFKALSFIATPWDFHADVKGNFAEHLLEWAREGLPKISAIDYVPADWLQMIFAGIDPAQIARKFTAFDDMPMDDLNTDIFIAVEDWVNGGVDIPSLLLIESTKSWYRENKIFNGAWHMDGKIISAAQIQKPAHVTVPTRDRIVPPQSALPLAAQLPNAILHQVDGGHISMMMGRKAEPLLWQPLSRFFMAQCTKFGA